MNTGEPHSTSTNPTSVPLVDDLPPGDHPLEVAARRGIGPLSPSGQDTWHGHTTPCVSCGQLNPRDARVCAHCGQDLSPEMLEKMRAAAGPWYVLEHVRPFPGVLFDRLVRQIRRGVLTATSIVRGPTTLHQWRFAGETPGLAKYLGLCWNCGEPVEPQDVYCPSCLTHVDGVPQSAPLTVAQLDAAHDYAMHPAVTPAVSMQSGRAAEPAGLPPPTGTRAPSRPVLSAPAVPLTPELRELSAVVEQADAHRPELPAEELPKLGGIRASWIIAILTIVLAVILIQIVRSRERVLENIPTSRPAAGLTTQPPSPTPDDSPEPGQLESSTASQPASPPTVFDSDTAATANDATPPANDPAPSADGPTPSRGVTAPPASTDPPDDPVAPTPAGAQDPTAQDQAPPTEGKPDS